MNRQFYLPKDRADDAEPRANAAVPEDIAFLTKPAMARELIARILDAVRPRARA